MTTTKKGVDSTTFEEKFLYYMKKLPTFVDKPDTHNDKFFEELLMEAEYLKMDTETQAQYDRRVKQMRDAKNVEDYMIKTSIAKGLKQGLEQGLEEGRAAEKLEVAKNFLRLGVDVETISKATGLSVEVLSEMQD